MSSISNLPNFGPDGCIAGMVLVTPLVWILVLSGAPTAMKIHT